MAPESPFDLPFDSLPDPRRVWVGEPGSYEEGRGKLALLTPEVVARAAAEIRTGQRVTLNWDLTRLEMAAFGRQPCQHHIIPLLDGHAYDDVYIFNPQQSSQWDGLRHYSQPDVDEKGEKVVAKRVFYGGTTSAEISGRKSDRIGIQHWAKDGIAGRGVLIDYASYAEKRGIKYSTFSPHEVSLDDIQAVAEECNISFQRGDILLVRIGMIKEWETGMTDAQKMDYKNSANPQHAGVEASMDMLRWLWNCGFAAVAGDAISWEVYPPSKPGPFLHEYLLAGWGVPIGEMFDLEALAAKCRELGRWSFFVSSVPLNMPGGVSSPPNAMAVF